jgi:hypothetical protein
MLIVAVETLNEYGTEPDCAECGGVYNRGDCVDCDEDLKSSDGEEHSENPGNSRSVSEIAEGQFVVPDDELRAFHYKLTVEKTKGGKSWVVKHTRYDKDSGFAGVN